MKILFVTPLNHGNIVETTFPHLGLGYLASYLKLKHPEVQFKEVHSKLDKHIRKWRPDVVAITSVSQYWNKARYFATVAHDAGIPVIVGGIHVSCLPQTMTRDMDTAVIGEGEQTFAELMGNFTKTGRLHPEVVPGTAYWNNGYLSLSPEREVIPRLDVLPFPDRSFQEERHDFTSMFTSRGCPYKCLTGDTVVHTIKGDFPIAELVGQKDVMVLTRDPVTHGPIYAKARNICLVQRQAKLVRVHFDDSSYIDCTPDHKFKVFSYKNQACPVEQEYDIEARDLKPKQQVRAIRFEVSNSGRVLLSTERNIVIYRNRVVMEATLGRKLLPEERVHHKDRNKANDLPENLELTDKHNHTSLHPEISEKMKTNNPARNMTPEWREKLANSARGQKRTIEQRMRYRSSKMGEKNPRFDPEITTRPPRKSRVPGIVNHSDVNHKVVRIEHLDRKGDVYCLEVPEAHWFYANKVLVHNCSFCASTRYFTRVRFFSAEYVAEEIYHTWKTCHVKRISFLDDLFIADRSRLVQIADLLERNNMAGKLKFVCNVRSNLVTDDLCYILRHMGIDTVGIGMESACPRTLAFLKGARNITVEDHARALELLHRYGITAHPSFIIGSPDETEEEIMETLRFIKEHHVPDYEVYVLMPFPNTPVWDEAEQRGLVSPGMDWNRLQYTIADFGPDSIVLSKNLSYDDLHHLYRLFIANRSLPRTSKLILQGIRHPLRAAKYVVNKIS